MEATDAIRRMLERSGKPASAVSAELGLSKSNISNRLNRRVDMGSSTVARVARICGYRLLLVGRGETIEIDGGEGKR